MAYNPRKIVNCTICGRPSLARRLCRTHYYRAYAKNVLQDHPKLGPNDVFDSRYKIMPSGCWEWTGGHNAYGYGIIMLPGTNLNTRAHRFSYERYKGPIPTGKIIMHTCDNPPCVNPEHLLIGTRGDNNRDAMLKGRRPSGKNHWTYRIIKSH